MSQSCFPEIFVAEEVQPVDGDPAPRQDRGRSDDEEHGGEDMTDGFVDDAADIDDITDEHAGETADLEAGDAESGDEEMPLCSLTQSAAVQSIEQIVRPVVESCGVQLYDIESPTRPGGVLRVYVWKGPESYKAAARAKQSAEDREGFGDRGGIVLDECARVSKALELVSELDQAIEGAYILEVSSPGITRRLSRQEHFTGAIGELVKLTLVDGSVVVGELTAVDAALMPGDLQLTVREPPKAASDKKGRPISKRAIAAAVTHTIALSQVRRARVEFEF